MSGRIGFRLVCISLAATCAASASAQTADVTVTYSTTPLTRNADLMLTASILATAAGDAGLEALSPSLARGSRPRGRLVRAAKLVLLDSWVVNYVVGLNHEWGHQAAADEFGVESRLYFEGSPWSSKPFVLVALSEFPETPPAKAVLHGGGLEASRRLKDMSEWRMTRADRIPSGQALATVLASLDTPIYAFGDLSPGQFRDSPEGDVITLVFDLARRRGIDPPGFDRTRHDVRTRAALNLLDAALWTETLGLLRDYVWNGETSVRVRWLHIGGAEMLPSARYELSPFGPEYYVGSYFKALGTTARAYGRWTERIVADRLTGGGGSFQLPSLVGAANGFRGGAVPATVTVDAWSHTVDGFGMHASIAADVENWPARRAALTIAVGAKSSGHLIGYALESGAYVTVGMNLRAW